MQFNSIIYVIDEYHFDHYLLDYLKIRFSTIQGNHLKNNRPLCSGESLF